MRLILAPKRAALGSSLRVSHRRPRPHSFAAFIAAQLKIVLVIF